MLTLNDILFYSFGLVAVISSIVVIFLSNPIYSALFLALTMSVLGAFFFILEAYFVSVAQITVYAGAVMVLFVMVLMLFDLKHEKEEIFKISPLSLVKLLSGALLCGFFVGTAWLAVNAVSSNPASQASPQVTAQQLEKTPLTGSDTEKKKQLMESASLVNDQEHPEDEDLTSAEADSLVEKADKGVKSLDVGSTQNLSTLLFSNYVFAFEAVSLLLLVAIVGSVALARSKGGTHHAPR